MSTTALLAAVLVLALVAWALLHLPAVRDNAVARRLRPPLTATSPLAIYGFPIHVTDVVPEGFVYLIGGEKCVHPNTYAAMKNVVRLSGVGQAKVPG